MFISTKFVVLIVDDEPDQQRGLAFQITSISSSIDAIVRHPEDVTEQDLSSSSLILVDLRLSL